MDNLIGQRFSLISKSEIRYVGTLHEINPEQSTIALEDVLSFGTEDRQAASFIPPSTQRFEYILFRGQDVKDIKPADEVAEPKQASQPPNDPAILNSSRPGPAPPAQGPPSNRGESPFPPQNYPPGAYGGYYPAPAQFGRGYGPPPPPGAFGPGPGHPPYGPPPGYFGPPGAFPGGPNRFQPPPPPIGPPGQRPPPPTQQPPAPGPPQPPATKQTPELPVEKTASRSDSKTSTPAPQAQPPASQQRTETALPQGAPAQPPAPPKAGQVTPAMPFTVNQKSFIPPPSEPTAPSKSAAKPAPSQQEMDEASRQAREAVAAATAKIAAQTASTTKPFNHQPSTSTAVDTITEKVAQLSTTSSSRGRGNYRGGRGVRTSSGGQRQKMEIPQSDFDFASSNAKFNKEDLVKEAIASGSPLAEHAEEQPNGPTPVRRDSLQNAPAPGYNKASSFFDNISSEAKDREDHSAEKLNPRALRGQEFKKNIETFGQGNVDSGYRGRGRGYRGRGRGGNNYRGAYRGRGARQGTEIAQG